MLIYALDAAHFTANFGAKRGAEIAPPSNNIVVDTLSLDAPHHHSLIERVTGAFTLSEPQDRCRVVEHQVVRHALPDSVEDAPEVVLQTKCADVLVVDFLSANAQRLERLGIGIRLVQDLGRRRRVYHQVRRALCQTWIVPLDDRRVP